MATRVQEFERALPRYPWDEWTDGSIWRVVRGEDFDVEPRHFVAQVYRQAKSRGMEAQASVNGEIVTFQFSKEAA